MLDRVGRMAEEAAARDSVLLHENEKGIYGDSAPAAKSCWRPLWPHFKAVFDFANFVQVGQQTLPMSC